MLAIDFIKVNKGIDRFFVSMFLFFIDILKKTFFIQLLFIFLYHYRHLKKTLY